MGDVSSCVGIVLAGGRSRRFGRPKAWAHWGGTSFVERLHRLLDEVFAASYVVLHEPSDRFAGMNTLLDLRPDGGAMNGIYSALETTRAAAVFVAACDLPCLQRQDLERLLQHWRPELPALVYRRNGAWEPLCGIYGRTLLPALRSRLEAGRYSLQDLLTKIGAEGLEYPEGEATHGLMNINTPEAYRALMEMNAPPVEGR